MISREQWEEYGVDQKEEYLVKAIKAVCLTLDQRQALFLLDLSIEDLLNGRFTLDKAPVANEIFADWNKTLGFHYFGF
jgi:hypothetical protein